MGASDKPKQTKESTFATRVRSFKNAFSGLSLILKNEHNFRIHLFILLIVVVAGIYFKVKASDWIAIVVVSGIVLSAECFNSAIEYLSDEVSADVNPGIKNVKDAAAAGVLISAIMAVIVGLIIFIPQIIKVFT